jgi:hypothetical protein
LTSLAVFNASTFDAGGASYGVQRDLDSDGDLDVGGTDPTDADGYWTARAGAVRRSPTATQSYTWKVATLTFTVTQLIAGTGTTEVNSSSGKARRPGRCGCRTRTTRTSAPAKAQASTSVRRSC